ncbi:MAG TPA: hypothetical protein VHB77_19895 [Planctomycetaceae bacterium]|nr:hypothetical protein [Planctomycetaceae bacterium]
MFRLIPAAAACVAVSLAALLWGAEPKPKLKPKVKEKAQEKAPFTYRVTKKRWEQEDDPVPLCDQTGFAILSAVGGGFTDNDDFVQLRVDAQRNWSLLGGGAAVDMCGRALVIERLTPRLFAPEPEVFEWKLGQPAVKMIAADKGVCFLSLFTGHFGRTEDGVWIEKRDDGFYWLNGKSAEKRDDPKIRAQAIALKFHRGQGKKVTTSNHRWSAGDKPLEIFPKAAGLCFLTRIAGDIHGDGEAGTLDINAQDVWVLSGRPDLEELQFDVLGLRWDGK